MNFQQLMAKKLGGKYAAPPVSLPGGGEEWNGEKNYSEMKESTIEEENGVEEADG